MTVIVSDATNPAYDGLLSTANGFFRAESYNLVPSNSTTLNLASIRQIPVTFANSGNCQGIILALLNPSPNLVANYSVVADLLQIMGAVTLTIASPCVVTLAAHGFSGNEPIILTTTGALPTGLVANTTYYVKYIDATTFNLSATPGGANINTSGSQSGVHTLYAVRATQTQTPSQIANGCPANSGAFIVPFVWTPYGVDTASNKWVFRVSALTGSGERWFLPTSDGTNPFYITWCDNVVSFVSGSDCVIAKDTVIIDQTATFAPYAGTGASPPATYGTCAVACRNIDPSTANVCNFVWKNPPASSYTLTIDGCFILSAYSGFRMGTSDSPIPIAQKGTIIFKYACSVGGQISGFTDIGRNNGYSFTGSGHISLIFYGEIPPIQYTTLQANAAAGQKNIITSDDTGWTVGDILYLGREGVAGLGDDSANTINTITTTAIGLTNNIAGQTRYAGASVINISLSYGISIRSDAAANCSSYCHHFSNLTLSGCNLYYVSFGGPTTTASGVFYSYETSPSNKSIWMVTDCVSCGTTTPVIQNLILPAEGLTINRFYSKGQPIIIGYSTATYGFLGYRITSGKIVINGCRVIKVGSTYVVTGGSIGTQMELTYNSLENCNYLSGYSALFIGTNGKCDYNSIWGKTSYVDSPNYPGLAISTVVNPVSITGNEVNKCYLGIGVGLVVGAVIKDTAFGNILGNTKDIDYGIAGVTYTDVVFEDTTGIANNYLTDFYMYCVSGSRIKFVNYNGSAGDDRVYSIYGTFQRTGLGLTDTTAHTVGGYALRFQPNNPNLQLEWQFNIPTGDIQSKTMVVAIWCKINAASYYSGVHTNPTLSVNYDNGTIITTVAADTTDWQLLSCTFMPTTTYGQIIVTVSGATDQLITNAYFYIDDMSVLYPAGYVLNLGALDVWADALPVLPPISTSISAFDVWVALVSTMTGAGTIGKLLADYIDAAISSRAPSATALDKTIWTDLKAGYIDAAISSRAPEAAGNVAAIKTKTDQLNFVGADVKATLDGEVVESSDHADVGLIKAQTDQLNFDGTDVIATLDGELVDLSAAYDAAKTAAQAGDQMALTNAAIDAILDGAMDGTITLRQAMRLLLAELAGKASGGGTASIIYRDPGDTKDRVIMTVDANGNRSAVVVDVS